jgi:hypothetical protein
MMQLDALDAAYSSFINNQHHTTSDLQLRASPFTTIHCDDQS